MNTPRVQWNPPLTRRLVESGVFKAEPFCLADVGASGGIDSYWEAFGDSLRAIGFDGLIKEVERLNAAVGQRDRRYYAYLVGDKSYRAPEGVPDTQPFPRTSAVRATEIANINYAGKYFDQTGTLIYSTEMIELDQFFLRDHPQDIDFIKVDTDGSDYPVLRGARELLSSGRVLGVGIECQFHGPVHDESNTFRNIDRFMTSLGYSLFDLEIYRYSRAALPGRFVYRLPAQTETGQVLWGDALYLRDAGNKDFERDWKVSFQATKILKLACIFELFGLQDCVAELLLKYRTSLAGLIDVGSCLDLITPQRRGKKISYSRYVEEFEKNPETFYPPK